MKRRSARLLFAVVLLALAVWGWRALFPSPERAIRQRLTEVARLASFGPNEAPAAKLYNSQKLASFCTSDVEINVDVPGHRQTFSGQDELAARAMGVRQALSALNVEFLGMVVSVAPGKQSALVNLTAKAKVPGESDLFIQELKLVVKRHGRDWFISQAETVKTLR